MNFHAVIFGFGIQNLIQIDTAGLFSAHNGDIQTVLPFFNHAVKRVRQLFLGVRLYQIVVCMAKQRLRPQNRDWLSER